MKKLNFPRKNITNHKIGLIHLAENEEFNRLVETMDLLEALAKMRKSARFEGDQLVLVADDV